MCSPASGCIMIMWCLIWKKHYSIVLKNKIECCVLSQWNVLAWFAWWLERISFLRMLSRYIVVVIFSLAQFKFMFPNILSHFVSIITPYLLETIEPIKFFFMSIAKEYIVKSKYKLIKIIAFTSSFVWFMWKYMGFRCFHWMDKRMYSALALIKT